MLYISEQYINTEHEQCYIYADFMTCSPMESSE